MAIHLKIDSRDIEKLSAAMKQISEKNAKYAVYESFNKAAFWARKEWQAEMRSTLILRNQFTERSIQIRKASGSKHGSLSKIEARIGSVASYMDNVEQGETEHKKGEHGVAVPMGDAAGQGFVPTTRVVRENRRIATTVISRPKAGTWKSRKQLNAAAIRMAKTASKDGFAFLDLGKTKGVFRILKRGKPKLVWNYSHSTVRMAPHKTLWPVVQKAAKVLPYVMERELQQQIRRALARL